MTLNTLHYKQKLPISLDTAWDFFSNPHNLKLITPPKLGMTIINSELLPKEIYAGLLIQYNIALFGTVNASWLTEITQMIPKKMFIDEQRIGPYTFWHHRHFFTEIDGGVLIEDQVTYQVPGWFIGDLLLSNYIKKQLEDIFAYRKEKIVEFFPGHL